MLLAVGPAILAAALVPPIILIVELARAVVVVGLSVLVVVFDGEREE